MVLLGTIVLNAKPLFPYLSRSQYATPDARAPPTRAPIPPIFAPMNAPARSAPVMLMEFVILFVKLLFFSLLVMASGCLVCHSLVRLAISFCSFCKFTICLASVAEWSLFAVSVSSLEQENAVIVASVMLTIKNIFFIIKLFLIINIIVYSSKNPYNRLSSYNTSTSDFSVCSVWGRFMTVFVGVMTVCS